LSVGLVCASKSAAVAPLSELDQHCRFAPEAAMTRNEGQLPRTCDRTEVKPGNHAAAAHPVAGEGRMHAAVAR
jgi:hypothetical protein